MSAYFTATRNPIITLWAKSSLGPNAFPGWRYGTASVTELV